MSGTVSIDDLSAGAEEASADDVLCIATEGFEGPLHLLLDLARRQKVDLRHVSILDLAEQYLAFVRDAKARRIDLAADYLLMAAWLAYLKSRLLLPKEDASANEAENAGDMADRLAFRLKRLEAMRTAAAALQNGHVTGNVVFLRGQPEQPKVVRHTEYDASLYLLAQALGAIRWRREEVRPHRIEKQFVLPLEAARTSLKSIMPSIGDWASLETIRRRVALPDSDLPERSVTASVFTAALELARDGEIDMRQSQHFTPLYLRGSAAQNREATQT